MSWTPPSGQLIASVYAIYMQCHMLKGVVHFDDGILHSEFPQRLEGYQLMLKLISCPQEACHLYQSTSDNITRRLDRVSIQSLVFVIIFLSMSRLTFILMYVYILTQELTTYTMSEANGFFLLYLCNYTATVKLLFSGITLNHYCVLTLCCLFFRYTHFQETRLHPLIFQ